MSVVKEPVVTKSKYSKVNNSAVTASQMKARVQKLHKKRTVMDLNKKISLTFFYANYPAEILKFFPQ